MASASSAMVSGPGAAARISRARMPRDSVWEGEAGAGAGPAGAAAVEVMVSILGGGIRIAKRLFAYGTRGTPPPGAAPALRGASHEHQIARNACPGSHFRSTLLTN
ncbi:hypothetical protein ARTHRO9AX_180224 [Arthrobacter sp. 9AX]|nr:hypothetical protein ARTHRO9AX_180224 [Arthrobacter sp. 9AX]